jgi:DNA-binding transcriptional MerR regulator
VRERQRHLEHYEQPGQGNLLPIGAVARLTGVPEMTLRNWEKRYGVPRPGRTADGGRRLYSGDDITLVRHLAQRVASGVPIRKAVAAVRAVQQEPERLAASLLSATLALDAAGVQRDLEEAAAALPPTDAWSRIVAPVLRNLGDRWAAGGDGAIAAEHLATSAIQSWLRSLLGGYVPLSSAQATVACGPGELHELGALALVTFLTMRGTSTVYLGANTPLIALEDIRRRMGIRVLCITATLRATADQVVALIMALTEHPTEAVLAYGGPGFDRYDAAHARLAGYAVYLGTSLEDAIARVEQLCTPR